MARPKPKPGTFSNWDRTSGGRRVISPRSSRKLVLVFVDSATVPVISFGETNPVNLLDCNLLTPVRRQRLRRNEQGMASRRPRLFHPINDHLHILRNPR